jgi:uncharacterized protein (DUF2267 family)
MDKREFVTVVQVAANLASPEEATALALAVTRALSQLVSNPAERRHFITQLPGFLKTPLRDDPPEWLVMDREALLQHVAHILRTHVPEATRALRAVWRGLRAAIAPGQIAQFERHLPRDVVALLEPAPSSLQ